MSTLGNILVVEDDAGISTILKDLFEDAGYSCELAADGLLGVQRALAGKFDLLVLDVGLPSLSGLDICRQVKSVHPALPIIILTARGEELDVVLGLEVGADDYLAKPFRPRELLARVRARLREEVRRKVVAVSREDPDTEPRRDAAELAIGDIHIDAVRMRVRKGSEVLALSAREYEVVLLLASHAGRPFSREELLSTVWEFDSEDYEVNVSVFMSRLRRKLEDDPNNPKYLLTVRGVGYKFAEAVELER